ncbi:MAG: hypothetical protein ACRDZW_09460 [Acidimicrobiales bacterium]
MPAPTRPDRTRTVVVGSVVALALAAVLLALVVRFAAQNPDRANLGSPVLRFNAGRLSEEIAKRGPFLFKDPLNNDREVYVQHLGTNANRGWLAVGAYASRVSLDCLLGWNAPTRRFVDPCTTTTYPPDGAGLTTYPATVTKGVVNVDLRKATQGVAVGP